MGTTLAATHNYAIPNQISLIIIIRTSLIGYLYAGADTVGYYIITIRGTLDIN